MNDAVKTMMMSIRYKICGEPFSDATKKDFSDDFLMRLFRLSEAHDMAHIVGSALEENRLLRSESKVAQLFRNRIMIAVYHYEQLNYELGRICETFEREKIPFIPLKGAVLRQYYPKPWLRTSCDIDVFIREKDLGRATVKLEKELSYRSEGRGAHDVGFTSPFGIRLELHYNFVEERATEKSELPLKNIWNYAYADENSVRYRLTNEMFYYYHIAHMAKHFVSGGCGVRPFLDILILNGKIKYDEEKKAELLKKGDLVEFERAAKKLCDVWFKDEEPDDITETMQKYVLSGGIYGSAENRAAAKKKSEYMRSRIFLPYDVLKEQYPVLRKHKMLFPFMQVRRWLGLIFKGRLKQYKIAAKANKAVGNGKREETAKMMSALGL
ncbi:MAG TPA: hypothetical protein DDW54_02815 [Clostridiales bacterium]|nr:hypothetical protein [Clostridiales bacterium]